MEARDLVTIASSAPDSCFVVHTQSLLRNLTTMKRVTDASGAKLLLALKGYACHSTFPTIRPFVSGIAASSPHEAQLGWEKMGGEIHSYAPAYSEKDVLELMQWCNHIVFNSTAQLLRFAPMIRASGKPIELAVRINPEHSEVKTEIYDPSAARSRLGIRLRDWSDEILQHVSGLHVHNLCECDSYALERTLDVLRTKFDAPLRKVRWLNMGGGHHISRPGYDVDHLVSLIRDWKKEYGHEVYLEPGEAFGIHTGVLKSCVLDVQPSTPSGVANAILNVSATAHMPDTLEMPYRPEIWGAGLPGEKQHTYRLGGVTCLAGDVIGEYSFDQPLRPGDPLIFMDMAHYTMVKTSFFNGVQMPAIAVYDSDDQSIKVVRQFGYEDYANKLS
jgi:carboxynorspermidine decarboxylase